jgi:hypothetical protein
MWKVWIKINIPHIWGKDEGVRLDVGLVPGDETEPDCGKSWEAFSTTYPQKRRLFNSIHILETSKTAPYIWGDDFGDVDSRS